MGVIRQVSQQSEGIDKNFIGKQWLFSFNHNSDDEDTEMDKKCSM